jgi:hypothetical protein
VNYEVESHPPTVVLVTAADGTKYELQIAILILGVMDLGIKNPIDQMPLFSLQSQVVTQTKRRTNG